MGFKKIFSAIVVFMSFGVLAEVPWKNYSKSLLEEAQKTKKLVVLGFHKQGCSACALQDSNLEATGFSKRSDVEFIKVEQKDQSLNGVYESYGLTQKQWSALVLLRGNVELGRVAPGTTDKKSIEEFVAKAN